jgi:hypothetical protein
MNTVRLALLLATGGLLMLLLTCTLLPSVAGATSKEAGHSRNVEIVSEGATQTDLHLNRFREFDSFMRSHPAIARDIDHQPTLIRSTEFRSSHPQWATFLRQHPAIKADIQANPGNYVVIRPEVASTYWHRHDHMKTNKEKV